YAGAGVMVDFDQHVIKVVLAPKTIARFPCVEPEGAVISPICGIFAPSKLRVDSPCRQQSPRDPATVGAPPHADQSEQAGGRPSVAFALVRPNPGAAEHDGNGVRADHE